MRLDLSARQPAPNGPPLYSVAQAATETRAGIPIIVTRPKAEVSITPLKHNERVAVGLTSFRVLPNFTLATERAGKIVATPK
ncbi:MAG: hypothetical protein LC731_08860 [Acidobacteria bacterium]|nr:hypothetical protein [Acidobacteriota bacterium]